MRFLVLATDYDGTLAHEGVVDKGTIEALQRCRQSGRKLILVTGRQLPELESVFPHMDLFDRVVAENGAVLYDPAAKEKRVLAQRPPDGFVTDLQARGVTGIGVGDVIVATWHPHETAVLESIRDLGLELQVIFNRDAVMVLPASVNKVTGFQHALADLTLSRHNAVGVGDAENDHAFLRSCECSVAVANAIPALKEGVDWVTEGEDGAGVSELIYRLIADDLRSLPLSEEKHGILFGRAGDRDIFIDADGKNVLLCGQSGGGKSTFVTGLIERIAALEYQACLIDPEGDYENIPGLLSLGNKDHPPTAEEVLQVLDKPGSSLAINLVGVKLSDRPEFFATLLTKLQEKRLRQGRPHWIIVDEAHHLLPSAWAPSSTEVAGQTASLLLVTVHPEHVSRAALRLVNVVAVIGKEPQKYVEEFARAIDARPPEIGSADLEPGEASVWFLDRNALIERMQSVPGKAERKRHRRKYAEGELGPDRAFYFRGAEGKMNLRAHNLNTFLQLAAGIDDDTWLFHLHRGDYSQWLSTSVKDAELGEEVRRVEQDRSLPVEQTREQISKAIEAKYTAPI
jgi:hydroxymethylpyrimidine pyrophosphatase-like HAD family hydrolase